MSLRQGIGQRWRAIVIIFAILAIILVLAWWLGVWQPFMLVGQAFGGAGDWFSDVTGGWYPLKTVNDNVAQPIRDWWDDTFCMVPGGVP